MEKKDYKKANSTLNVDRGHQASLASFAGSPYWSELNYLSNITPQAKDLNQGAWKNLEDAVRKGVKFRDSLYVITGPIYKEAMKPLPEADEPHTIPSGYFKIIYEPKGNAVGFIMTQDTLRNVNYCDKQVAISTIQEDVTFKLPVFKEPNSVLKRLGC